MMEKAKRPRGLTMQDGSWVINKQVRGRRIFERLHTGDFEVALQRFQERMVSLDVIAASHEWSKKIRSMEDAKGSWLNKTFTRLHARGKATGRGCTLTRAEFRALLLRSNGRCEVTDIEFSNDVPAGAKVAPFQMSIDRRDCKLGYHFDNCRVVCLAVNLAMSAWGEQVMIRIAEAMMLRHLQTRVGNVAQMGRANLAEIAA